MFAIYLLLSFVEIHYKSFIMKRRDFLKNSSLVAVGGLMLTPFDIKANVIKEEFKNKKAKNIIFLVSDGMSIGTLSMADQFLRRKTGKGSEWLALYREQLVQRSLMDMASASSIVTDSAAASSSWGGGVRINNGGLNISPNGKENLPILQKFKQAGKKVGCVTTVPIAHATPAGFCVSIKSRRKMDEIVDIYAKIDLDVMMGGGSDNFSAETRKDGRNMYKVFKDKGYDIVKNRKEMMSTPINKQLIGVFDKGGMEYDLDRQNNEDLKNSVPTLAEMTSKAIEQMKSHDRGFVLQVEAGKVDWAAHANDIGGLIYDQVAFDEAVKVAIDFAKKDENTLVIITTDHGNANPGLVYDKKANEKFDNLQKFKNTNHWILQGIKHSDSVSSVKNRIAEACNGWMINDEEAKTILSYYEGTNKETGLYNPRKLPFKYLAKIQAKWTSIGWNSMSHTSDYVELAAYGPGSELIKPFILNTDLHYLMLEATHIENNF